MYNIIVVLLIAVAAVSWFILISLPRHLNVLQMIPRVIVPASLSVIYVGFMVAYFFVSDNPFQNIIDIKSLMMNEVLVLAGLMHLIVFNLLVGAWICEEAYETGMHPRIRDGILFTTSLLGPLGYLLFLFVRKRMKVSAIFV